MDMIRYLERTVEMIYLDRHHRFTKRRVRVHSVDGRLVRAYCLEQRGPRVFRRENIMAIQPVKHFAV